MDLTEKILLLVIFYNFCSATVAEICYDGAGTDVSAVVII